MKRRVAQSDQDQGIVSQSGSGAEIVVLALEHIAQKWTMPVQNWKAALQRFAFLLGDRVPQDALA
jgi:transposase-like protein